MHYLLADIPPLDPQTHLQVSGNNYWQPAAVIVAALIAALIGQTIAHVLNDRRERLKAIRQCYADFGAAAWRYLWYVEREVFRDVLAERLAAAPMDWQRFVDETNKVSTGRDDAHHDLTTAKFGLLAHLRSKWWQVGKPPTKAQQEVEQMFSKVEAVSRLLADTPSEKRSAAVLTATDRARIEIREWVKTRIAQ